MRFCLFLAVALLALPIVIGCQSSPAPAAAPVDEVIEVRIYDIRDMLLPRNPSKPSFDLNEALSNTSSGGANRTRENPLIRYLRKTPRRIAISHTVNRIKQTVATPDAWGRFPSDSANTIRELNGNLIIRTTPTHHAQVLALLTQRRAERGVRPLPQELLVPDLSGFDIGRATPAEAGSAGDE